MRLSGEIIIDQGVGLITQLGYDVEQLGYIARTDRDQRDVAYTEGSEREVLKSSRRSYSSFMTR